MKIAIVGAGINGISTALELVRDGHQVTIYEQLNAAAENASFAPGGWLSPCALHSLSTPGAGMPMRQLRASSLQLLQGSALLGSSTWRWLRQWKKLEKQATKHRDWARATALQQLASYSQAMRQAHGDDLSQCAEHKQGALVLLRQRKDIDFWQQQMDWLHAMQMPCTLIDAEQAQRLEPGLAQPSPYSAALHFTEGQSMNPRLWTQHLRAQALQLGATIHAGVSVQGISTSPMAVHLQGQSHACDAIVLCTGASHQLLAGLGMQLPLMRAWGYSVTAPLRDPLLAPRSTVMDWSQQATITRMGQRVRITAGMELNSHADSAHHHPTLQRMYTLLNDCFPGGAQLSSPQVQVWRGVRGIVPDGLPVVGASAAEGVWLNLAHGSHGTALAAGCARALADQISQREAALDLQAFHPLRFSTKK